MSAAALHQEVLAFRSRVAGFLARLQLVVVGLNVSVLSFDRIRIPHGDRKQSLLRAIERDRLHLPLRSEADRQVTNAVLRMDRQAGM